jgi:putative transposase
MKTSRYTEAQIIAILRQAEGGVPVAELCREHGMSNASFYKWRAKYGGMDASLISQMKAMDRAIGAPLVQAQWRGRVVGRSECMRT